MSTSPKAIQATDRRVDYLLKAKQARNEKKELISIRKTSETRADDWAANYSIITTVQNMRLMPVKDYSPEPESGRAIGSDQHIKLRTQTFTNSPKPSFGGINEPFDMTVRQVVKNKNESGFTTSLINGDRLGYVLGQGP